MPFEIRWKLDKHKPYIFLSIVLLIIALLGGGASADIFGWLRYAYESNYSDQIPVQQVFAQDYLVNLNGPVYDARVGSFNLGLQYQKGLSETRNLTFSNTLNFHNALRLTTAYSKKIFESYANDPIIDDRFSIGALYYTPFLFSLNFGYEQGEASTPIGGGIDKYDRRAEAGFNYGQGKKNISAKYVKRVLYDNTYLAEQNNLVNREYSLSVTGAYDLGENMLLSGNFFDQLILNQLGQAMPYDQKLQNLSLIGDINLLSFLKLRPEFLRRVSFINYNNQTGETSRQTSNEFNLVASLRPVSQLELVATVGSGPLEIEDSSGYRRQDLAFQSLEINSNFNPSLVMNVDLKREKYFGGGAAGAASYLNGYLSGTPTEVLKIVLKKSYISYDGVIFAVANNGVRRQEINEIDGEMEMIKDLYCLLGAGYTLADANNYREISAGLRQHYGGSIIEFNREDRVGDEVTQKISSQSDSFKANLLFDNVTVIEQVSLIKTTIIATATTTIQAGFRNYSELQYSFGDSVFAATLNSEKKDQDSNVYTKIYFSFTRHF